MNLSLPRALRRTILGAAVMGLAAFYGAGLHSGHASAEEDADASLASLTVHKSPSCGCCGEWVKHMDHAGFSTDVKDSNAMNAVKQDLGIEPRYQSCHTSVSADGYFFEGHIPAKYVEQFLREPPKDAVGLAVPGMPMGSPGMEMGGRFTPYDVVQINKDGSVRVYAQVLKPEDQY